MPCGHCDNCTRDPDSISEQDVTLEAWQILRVAAAVAREGGRVTVGMLCDLARGNGGGVIGVSAGKKKSKEDGAKVALNLDELIGGKVTMNKDVRVASFSSSVVC
jgi:ATP-dependent DNA helicase Q1